MTRGAARCFASQSLFRLKKWCLSQTVFHMPDRNYFPLIASIVSFWLSRCLMDIIWSAWLCVHKLISRATVIIYKLILCHCLDLDGGAVPLFLCHMLQKDFQHPPFLAFSPTFRNTIEFPTMSTGSNDNANATHTHILNIHLTSVSSFVSRPYLAHKSHTPLHAAFS